MNPILSEKDLADVESIYKRLTTPIRCLLRLHRWEKWEYIFSCQYGVQAKATGRRSDVGQVDIQMRLCPDCMKVQAKAVTAKVESITPFGIITNEGEEDE